MWDKNVVDLLIVKYKEHENLYNARNPKYVDRAKRSNSLLDICKKLKELKNNVTVEDIRKKIHTLRAQYIKEYHAIANSRRNAVSATDVYKPTLWCFDKLVFLEPHIDIRRFKPKLSNTTKYDESNIEDEVSSDVQSKPAVHHHRSDRFNECDESNVKIEISIEENSETSTQRHCDKRFNNCGKTNIEEDVSIEEISEPPTGHHCDKRTTKYDESNIEDEVSSDVQSKPAVHHHRSDRFNECDESNVKIEISIEENSETSTQRHCDKRFNNCGKTNIEEDVSIEEISEPPTGHHCDKRFNDCCESNIEVDVAITEIIEPPTQQRVNKRFDESDESNNEDNVSIEEKSEPPTQHRCKKRKITSILDEQIDNVNRLLVKRLEKNNDYDWLGKQVVFEMNSIKNKKVQRDTAWKIQTILREASIEDEAISECQSEQLSRGFHSDTQSSCGSCSSIKPHIRSSLLSVIQNSDSIDRSFSSSYNPVRPLHPVRLISTKCSDTSTSYLYSPDNLQQAFDGL